MHPYLDACKFIQIWKVFFKDEVATIIFVRTFLLPKVVPRCLRERAVVSVNLEKAEERVDNEEYIVNQLEALHGWVVLGEDQTIKFVLFS